MISSRTPISSRTSTISRILCVCWFCAALSFAAVLQTGTAVAQSSTSSSSSNELRARYGLFGHVAFTQHSADFARLPETQSCCSGFTGGSGTGLAGGLLAEFPIASRIHIGARLGILTQPFSMTTFEPTTVIVNGNAEAGGFEHRLDGNLMTLGLEPLIGVRVFASAFIHAGARVGFAMSSSYEQLDALTLPEATGTFLNPDGSDSFKRTRNEYSGSLSKTSLQIAPMIGVSYELQLNSEQTWLIVPEVFYQIGLTNVITDSSWKANTIRAGISLKWSPASTQQQPVKYEEEDEKTIAISESPASTTPVAPPPIPSNVLTAALAASGLDANGNPVPAAKFVVEEYSSTLMTPLLPYVFFDENSDKIPTRYSMLQSAATQSFDIDAVNQGDKLRTYHELLNIVAKRMRMYPDAKIVITGNNMDVRDEKSNTGLSARRADVVKQYLISVWGISPTRISTDARSLPSKAANTLTQDGSEENRRAEIVSDDPRILAPIISSDTLRTANPPVIVFTPTVTATSGVATWNLTAHQDNVPLRVFNGANNIPREIKWNIDDEKSSMPRKDSPVRATLRLTDQKGASTSADATLAVEQITIRTKKQERRGDKIIDRFSLILFDVRSADLGTEHKAATDIIRSHIKSNSSVTVTGYTDRLGDTRFNQQLAQNRASAVASALNAQNASTKGIGQADLYDSTLPEGRLYTRTVNVVIETPITN